MQSIYFACLVAVTSTLDASTDGRSNDWKNVTGRKLLGGGSLDVLNTLGIPGTTWKKGGKGEGVKIGIFDTGLARGHAHFRGANIVKCVDFTQSGGCEDGFGHGSFVAGLIGSRGECHGMAPDAEIYIFKVFTDRQISFTSWFLDALNHAIDLNLDVINLSIGGPDYMDKPFTDKIREAVAHGITIVSAIGNDGPLYGTLNNPADQIEVIGVGGITHSKRIASFSSRGMTTWELPQGYGRIKPDVVAHGEMVRSTAHRGGCKSLSGTSVASPVVAGVVVGLMSVAKKLNLPPNPAFMKQLLTTTSRRIPDTSVYEQGSGIISVSDAVERLETLKSIPGPSFIPPRLTLEDCKLFWPHCHHPVYHTSMPVVVNVTIANPTSVRGKIIAAEWSVTSPNDNSAKVLSLGVEYSENVWPWFGWLSISISIMEPTNFTGVVEGVLRATLKSGDGRKYSFPLVVSVKVVKRPEREKRILWDVYHNLQYPPAYIARDDLQVTGDVLDWNGDHPHTNFRDAFNNLVLNGWHVDILSNGFTGFEAANYAVLLLIDTEEEFAPEEVEKLREDVKEKGLALVIFADWHNLDLMQKSRFIDDNTQELWTPVVGGANLPALNELLTPFGVGFSSGVYHGEAKFSDSITLRYASGTSIAKFPSGGVLYRSGTGLTDAVESSKRSRKKKQTLFHAADPVRDAVPILGLTSKSENGVRIAAYGDSGCLDTAHSGRNFCFQLLEGIMKWAATGRHDPILNSRFKEVLKTNWVDPVVGLPERMSTIVEESHALHGGKDRRDATHHPKLITGVRAIEGSISSSEGTTHLPPPPTPKPLPHGATDPIVTVPPSREFYYHYTMFILPLAFVVALLLVSRVMRRRRRLKVF